MTAILTTNPTSEWQTMTAWPDLTLPVVGDRVVLVALIDAHGQPTTSPGVAHAIVASGTAAEVLPILEMYSPEFDDALDGTAEHVGIDSDGSAWWTLSNGSGTRITDSIAGDLSPTAECPMCDGMCGSSGMIPYHYARYKTPCPDCNGSGTLPRYAVRLTDVTSVEDRCPECWDTGTSEHGPTERETERGWVQADPRRACPTCWQQEITRVPPIPLTPPANRDAWEWTP